LSFKTTQRGCALTNKRCSTIAPPAIVVPSAGGSVPTTSDVSTDDPNTRKVFVLVYDTPLGRYTNVTSDERIFIKYRDLASADGYVILVAHKATVIDG
jgi:hypothetical protein